MVVLWHDVGSSEATVALIRGVEVSRAAFAHDWGFSYACLFTAQFQQRHFFVAGTYKRELGGI
eukprot:4410366-Pyramimonas_sp.AAC.1